MRKVEPVSHQSMHAKALTFVACTVLRPCLASLILVISGSHVSNLARICNEKEVSIKCLSRRSRQMESYLITRKKEEEEVEEKI